MFPNEPPFVVAKIDDEFGYSLSSKYPSNLFHTSRPLISDSNIIMQSGSVISCLIDLDTNQEILSDPEIIAKINQSFPPLNFNPYKIKMDHLKTAKISLQ